VDTATFDDNNMGVNVIHNGAGRLTFDVLDSTVDGLDSGLSAAPVNISLAPLGGTMSGTIAGNVLTNSHSRAGPGVRVAASGAGTLTVLVDGNNISEVANRGIEIKARAGSNVLNATVTNNTVNLSSALAADAVHLASGATALDTTTVCADVRGNTATTIAGSFGIRVRERFAGTTFLIEDYDGDPADLPEVAAFLSGNNGGATASADPTGAVFGTIPDCPEPTP
jgi:hypothetical protein